MMQKGIDLALLSAMVFAALFVIGKLQDHMPSGARKIAMSVAPIPTGVVGKQSMSTLLMIALILFLANEMGGGKMLSGSRKTKYGKHRASRKAIIGSGGTSALDKATSAITPQRAKKGGIMTIGGDRCELPKAPGLPAGVPVNAPSVAVPGTLTDVGMDFQKQQDALGAMAMAANDNGKDGDIFL